MISYPPFLSTFVWAAFLAAQCNFLFLFSTTTRSPPSPWFVPFQRHSGHATRPPHTRAWSEPKAVRGGTRVPVVRFFFKVQPPFPTSPTTFPSIFRLSVCPSDRLPDGQMRHFFCSFSSRVSPTFPLLLSFDNFLFFFLLELRCVFYDAACVEWEISPEHRVGLPNAGSALLTPLQQASARFCNERSSAGVMRMQFETFLVSSREEKDMLL